MFENPSIRRLEKEIEELEAAARKGLDTGEPDEDVVDPEAGDQDVRQQEPEMDPDHNGLDEEEKRFSKRYADLRRSSQKRQQEDRQLIQELEKKIEKLSKTSGMPDTVEEAKSWAKENPKAAEIIRALAREEAKEFSPREELDRVKEEVYKAKQQAIVLKAIPDFDEVVSSADFQEWVDSQPDWVQDRIDNSLEAKDAIWAINKFKSETKPKADPNKDSAMMVRKGRTEEPARGRKRFSESQVNRMTATEYEANEEAITEAIRGGYFDYDLTGAAR